MPHRSYQDRKEYFQKYYATHREQQREKTKQWRKKNPERNLELNRQSCKRTRILLKQQVFQKLGNRCNSLNCRWINEDGSKGCTDPGCLQIDHVFGNGNIERTHNHLKDGRKFYKKVLTDTTGSYQILCANCNWIKRYDENSVGGGPRKISKMLLPRRDQGEPT